MILNGLSNIPEGINVILISRSDPPPALIRLRANHQMEVLGWNDLRLSLRGIGWNRPTAGQQKQFQRNDVPLHKAADGWAAGLVLMLEGAEKKVVEPQALDKLTPEEIFDYFGNELFDKTDKEIQEFSS